MLAHIESTFTFARTLTNTAQYDTVLPVHYHINNTACNKINVPQSPD